MIDTYIRHLIDLIHYERNSQIILMEEEIKELSALERQKKGRALNELSGKFIKKELDLAIAKFSSFGPIETEISVGDLVLISQGNPLEKNISGIVTEKNPKQFL